MNRIEPNRRFVRSAWALLAVQLAAAAVALAVTAWAAFQVRPLLAQREDLREQIVTADSRLRELGDQQRQAHADIADLEKKAAALRAELKGAREATPVLIEAINAFHRKEYRLAVARYDEALRLNPGDAYIYNLKSYSQFKSGDLPGAIETLSRSLELDPSYEWGYFDVARYQCAAGRPADGLATIRRALQVRGDSIKSWTAFFLKEDGEFRRLCSGVLPQLRELASR